MLDGSVVQKLPDLDEADGNFNEIELTQADTGAQDDKTIVVKIHSIDLTTNDLIKKGLETLQEMKKNKAR